MSNIKKLLEGIEVEWKTLGEVCDINTGQKPPIILDKPTNFDYINAGTSKSGYCKNSNCEGDTVTTPSRGQGGIGYVGYQSAPFWLGPLCYKLKSTDQSILINKFLFYFLQSECQLILGLKKEGGVPAVNKYDLANILIPIPPLEIQKEIVRILDKFSTLTAELTAELQARKSQYEYYRNQLLTYPMEESDQPSLRSSRSASSIQDSDNPTQPLSTPNPHTGNSVLQPRGKVEWKTLGEIGTLKTGRRFVRTDIQECGVPCFHYGDLYTFYGISTTHTKGYLSRELAKKLRFAQTNDIIIVCAGENDMDIGVGVAWLGEEPAVVHDACCILHHNQNPRYISHFLRTHNYHLQIKKYVKNGKISSLPVSGLEKAIIPIPYPNDREKSLKEQERIASILDKFDTITNSISEGLPKEIELRQKQYEYYRDMLLTFPTDNIKV